MVWHNNKLIISITTSSIEIRFGYQLILWLNVKVGVWSGLVLSFGLSERVSEGWRRQINPLLLVCTLLTRTNEASGHSILGRTKQGKQVPTSISPPCSTSSHLSGFLSHPLDRLLYRNTWSWEGRHLNIRPQRPPRAGKVQVSHSCEWACLVSSLGLSGRPINPPYFSLYSSFKDERSSHATFCLRPSMDAMNSVVSHVSMTC